MSDDMIPEDLDAATADLGLKDRLAERHDREKPLYDKLADNGYQPNVEAAVLNAVAQECYDTSEEHGFHDDWNMAAWLEDLAKRSEAGSRDLEDDEIDMLRDIAKTLRNNIIGTKLMLIVSELAEGLESLRVTGIDGHEAGEGNLGEELADAQVRIGDTAGLVHVAIGDELRRKQQVNAGRPHKHSKKF
jgi:NTP pyrophosphatase (non-canonical NTP hydrolase)